MKQLTFFALLIIVLCSGKCKDIPPYFPLEVGREWTYCSVEHRSKETTIFKWKVISDSMINGKSYFVMNQNAHSDDKDTSNAEMRFFRIENNNIYRRRSNDTSELLLYPAIDSIGKIYLIPNVDHTGSDICTLSYGDTITTPVSFYKGLVTINVNDTAHKRIYNAYFKPGIGMVAARDKSGIILYLMDYKIPGKK